VFLERCRAFASDSGSYALVAPQSWLFLTSFKRLRARLLQEQEWNFLSRLGSGAFETIGGAVVNVALFILTNCVPNAPHGIAATDASGKRGLLEKIAQLRAGPLMFLEQKAQLRNPEAKVIQGEFTFGQPLSSFADTYEGLHTGDYSRFGRKFWELDAVGSGWSLQQAAPDESAPYAGREHVIFWEQGDGILMQFVRERLRSDIVTMWIKGRNAWGAKGVAVSKMGDLKATIYAGEVFTHGAYVVIPKTEGTLPAIWAFCQSQEFREMARQLDQQIAIARGVLDDITFDLEHWQEVAEEAGPLPEPHSDDPTQWVFAGQPVGSSAPLQVAVSRLLGYQWPRQEPSALDRLANRDGIVCIPAVAGEQPAAEQLRALLAAAYRNEWSPARQDRLLAEVGSQGKSLEQWLRDDFFVQHCRLFHNRPFIWHVWDCRRDGFSVLLNYHNLDNKGLQRLTYTYLGWWIDVQRKARDAGEAGADGRLAAALELQKKLELILAGEPPYDIYVRWKPLHQQAIGWEPDLNDGVRLNIRPLVTAGVLRGKFNVNWNKDRGKNPDGSERINDLHFTIAEKRKAREEVR
jgi:hypothetical protein